jgi:anaerobic magnesium-protoporphyrin IX monomethyl ester cyclase
LPLMQSAGCDCIALGIESANQASLDFLNKKTTPRQATVTVRAIRAAKIRTLGYFILGIPGETWEDAGKTIRWARSLRLDFAQFASLNPTPGTPLKRWALDNGRFRQTKPLNPFDLSSPKPFLEDPVWTPDQVARILQLAYHAFYFSPGALLRRMLDMRSWRGIRHSLRSVVRLLFYLKS